MVPVSFTHIKINGVCSSGGVTTHCSGQAGFTIVHSRGNLIRNNSLVFGSIKPLYSDLNFKPADCLVPLLLLFPGLFVCLHYWFLIVPFYKMAIKRKRSSKPTGQKKNQWGLPWLSERARSNPFSLGRVVFLLLLLVVVLAVWNVLFQFLSMIW